MVEDVRTTLRNEQIEFGELGQAAAAIVRVRITDPGKVDQALEPAAPLDRRAAGRRHRRPGHARSATRATAGCS